MVAPLVRLLRAGQPVEHGSVAASATDAGDGRAGVDEHDLVPQPTQLGPLQETSVDDEDRVRCRLRGRFVDRPISGQVDDAASVATVATWSEWCQDESSKRGDVVGVLVVPVGGVAASPVPVRARG